MATAKVILTIQQRLDVLKDLETLPMSTVAEKYRVCNRTIQRIKENASKIQKFKDQDKRQRKRQRLRSPVYSEIDKCLYSWFIERRTLGDRVSDALLLEKASELKETMPTCSNFKVSNGWLSKFKNRHNIRLVRMYAEEVAADEAAARTFVENFQMFVRRNELGPETIYNMDECGLLWKTLPTKPLIRGTEKADLHKQRQERITISLCANATGTHKLTPLVIGKHKQPRLFKNTVEKLPVIFKSRKHAWMDQDLFADWYTSLFKPSVRQFQMENGISGRTVLLLDNCSGHRLPPNYPEDDHFEIRYLPPNTASLIQPMDQGISESTRTSFRCRMMRHVLQHHNGIQSFYSNYTINNCLELLAEAWSTVTCSNVRNAWRKIVSIAMPEIKEEEQQQLEMQEMQGMMSIILDETVDVEDIETYLRNCHRIERRLSTKMLVEERGAEDRYTDADMSVNERKGEEVDEIRDEETEQISDGTDEDDHENLKYQRKPEDGGISLNGRERTRLSSIFKELEEFIPRMLPSTRLHLQALKVSVLGRHQ